MSTVKPRNIDGQITCPPGYTLRPDGNCYPEGGVADIAAPASEAKVADERPLWQQDNEAGHKAYMERFHDPNSPHFVGGKDVKSELLPMSTESGGKGAALVDASDGGVIVGTDTAKTDDGGHGHGNDPGDE